MSAKHTATEKSLGVLHKMQAQVYQVYLEIILAGLMHEDPEERQAVAHMINPSMMNAINTFLKNNEITCTPELLDELTNVAKQIKARGSIPLPDMPDLEEMTALCGGRQ